MKQPEETKRLLADFWQSHPSYPLTVLDFLKSELKLGEKYVVAEAGWGRIGEMMLKHIHLLCVLHADMVAYEFIKSKHDHLPNFWTLHSTPENTLLDEDAIDCLIIDERLLQYNTMRVAKEFERVLRLNSFVIVLYNRLSIKERTFTQAYVHFFEQYSPTGNAAYNQHIGKDTLNQFYNDGYEERVFSNQLRLGWEGLQAHYRSSRGALSEQDPQYATALKALRILFRQYQVDGEVALDFDSHLVFGLFNKSVPAISLRKSIFFQVLRPFAFGFYVLVKLNIYFWRVIYSIKDRWTKKDD